MYKGTTFGEFVSAKRKLKGYTICEFCELVSLSPSFVSTMEHNKRPAPSRATQKLIAEVLELSKEDSHILYDLAAKTKIKDSVPLDISDIIMEDEDIKTFLRLAKKKGLNGKKLLTLI